MALADRPLVIEDGNKSFQLEKKSGKKCYMLAARALITNEEWTTDEDWTWITLPDSRFPEVAKLKDVCWFGIGGSMRVLALSPNTQYAVYLVYKMFNYHASRPRNLGPHRPVNLSVHILGGHCSTQSRYLEPNSFPGSQPPHVRSDGWYEIEMGEFFNAGLEDEVHMNVSDTEPANRMSGLIVEGIEVRPKEEN